MVDRPIFNLKSSILQACRPVHDDPDRWNCVGSIQVQQETLTVRRNVIAHHCAGAEAGGVKQLPWNPRSERVRVCDTDIYSPNRAGVGVKDFTAVPEAKNAIDRPSGDQKGKVTPVFPARV